ncbi:hypothetical protein R1flu_018695 [Riccia fluitans]|uniref:Uncharacterized protein n=1 Tax=Riccia fluitans TaxID=41844 RepID=A0ABD1ZGK1_9MARC
MDHTLGFHRRCLSASELDQDHMNFTTSYPKRINNMLTTPKPPPAYIQRTPVIPTSSIEESIPSIQLYVDYRSEAHWGLIFLLSHQSVDMTELQ